MIYMEVQQIEEKLKTALKPSRYRHTLGVAYTASCMAMVFGVDVHKAYRAGLLHDCAKGFSMAVSYTHLDVYKRQGRRFNLL